MIQVAVVRASSVTEEERSIGHVVSEKNTLCMGWMGMICDLECTTGIASLVLVPPNDWKYRYDQKVVPSFREVVGVGEWNPPTGIGISWCPYPDPRQLT